MPDIQTLIARLDGDPQDIEAVNLLAAELGKNPLAVVEALLPVLPDPSHPDGERGGRWENHSGNQRCEPLQVFEARSLDDLVGIVEKARRLPIDATVKAVATGYSVSDLATTTGFLVDTTRLTDVLPIEALRADVDDSRLFRFEAGLTIAELNEHLDEVELGIQNMPSASKLTFVGGMMTASHGSGASLGTLASQVRSLDLVGGDGKVYRIERSPGHGAITDPAAHAEECPDIVLKQDDDWFHSAVVSFGCLGLVYSVTIECADKYWLTETRTLSTWAEVKAALHDHAPGELPALLRDNRHYEVLINPYATDGNHTALVTIRNPAPEPDEPEFLRPARNWVTEMLAAIPFSDDVLVNALNAFPGLSPKAIDMAMEGLEDAGVVAVGHELLDLGAAATLDAYAIEVAFPWKEGLAAMDTIIARAAQARATGERYHNSPVSLRFVAAEDAYMAPQHGTVSCMIEVPMLVGTDGGWDHLERLQRALYAHGGRPHWGLELDLLSDAGGLVGEMYPKFEAFRRVHAQLDPDGIFANRTTVRLGLTRAPYRR